MDHYEAAAWAEKQGGALPTREQGDYRTPLNGPGRAFSEFFNRGGLYCPGHIWLAELNSFSRYYAWCQRLSDGAQNHLGNRDIGLPVLACFR